ncbi:MAG: hypothetical protein COS94_07960 [Candidatus Hydrogenedentes bacterium CG07_land_8_20_14_0_80_42_17]|nr:MAG: hypothetical protein COS94_07960 [Candidatus Hydrogenedentes bacterium CG07_land_8_20_14_0_80_42_17]
MKNKLSIAHWIGITALLALLVAGGFVVKWILTNQNNLQSGNSKSGVSEQLTKIISPNLLNMIGGKSGNEPREPHSDAIESLLAGSEEIPLPSEEKLSGLSVQTRETLRLRYNLGLLKFHQNDTPSAISAFKSVLDIDPQGAYGIRAFMQIGIIYSMSGNYSLAETYFRKVEALDPTNPLAEHHLGMSIYKMGRIQEAIQHLAKAATLDGANVGILQNLGNAYLSSKNFESAKKTFLQALEIDPNNFEIRFNLGLCYYRMNDLASAEEQFDKARAGLSGDNKARATAFLGITRYNRGFFGAAASAFKEAAELSSSNMDYRFNEGVALAKSGMPQDAAIAFRRALEISPRDAAAWFGLGSAYYMNGQKRESFDAYNKGLEIDTSASAPLFTTGFILMESGKVPEAAERFRKVVELGGQDALRAHVNLGLCYEAMGRLEDAAKEYRAGDPKDPRTFYNLGLILRKLGDKKGAVEAFLKATELKPTDARYAAALGDAYFEADMLSASVGAYDAALKNGGDDFEILIRIAQLEARLEKNDLAQEFSQRAISTALNGSQKARAYLVQGLILDRKGDLDATLKAFRQAVASDPRNADAYYNLGVVEARLRSYDSAVDALRVAIRLNPNHAGAHTQLGNIFAARGLREEAIREYETAVRIDSSAVEATFNLKELASAPR